jgi:hypothetical protein
MRTLLLLSAFVAAGSAFAGSPIVSDSSKDKVIPAEEARWKISSEFESGYSYASGVDTDRRDVDEQRGYASLVFTARHGEGIPIRFGLGWNRFSFSSTEGTRLPNTLQSYSAIAGIDGQIGDNIFFRLEAQPGWYNGSSRFLDRAFNVPVVLGLSYLVNKDLQFIVGFSFDVQRETPVYIGGGIRWQINDQLLANFVLPRPRLEYKVSDALTLYAGGEVFQTMYRVDGDFGNRVNHRELNNAWLNYIEIRFGGGATIIASDNINFDVEVGYLAYREAAFERADITAHSDSGGMYGGVALRAKF